jgi:hypothetical protein
MTGEPERNVRFHNSDSEHQTSPSYELAFR